MRAYLDQSIKRNRSDCQCLCVVTSRYAKLWIGKKCKVLHEAGDGHEQCVFGNTLADAITFTWKAIEALLQFTVLHWELMKSKSLQFADPYRMKTWQSFPCWSTDSYRSENVQDGKPMDHPKLIYRYSQCSCWSRHCNSVIHSYHVIISIRNQYETKISKWLTTGIS